MKTFETMSETLSKEANIESNKILVLSGPNLAEEVSENFSTASVLAGEDLELSLIHISEPTRPY